MPTWLIILLALAELVIIIFALIGVHSVRESIRKRGEPFYGEPPRYGEPPFYAYDLDTQHQRGARSGNMTPSAHVPAHNAAARPVLTAVPRPPRLRKPRPLPRQYGHLTLHVDNGPIPESRHVPRNPKIKSV